MLQAFGPCPIIPEKVEYAYKLEGFGDEARALPATRPNNELGRATSTMAKALKARILLYAASPLWNGSFPNPEWKNKNYETDGYGNELVSSSYDREKWTRALTACQEALTAAKEAGYQLFDIETQTRKLTVTE